MYLNFFGLHEKPFSIAPDPNYLYMTDQHREALAHLLFGIGDEGGFVLLTGEIGTGKTTVCRSLLDQLPENVDVAFIINPRLSVSELLESICDELAVEYDRGSSLKDLVDRLNRFLLEAYAAGKNVILIIDEAQNLADEVLEQLRLLTNLETSEKKLLQLILLGQPELRQRLEQPHLRQLEQRVTARFHLRPLNRKETETYIEHRLHVAGFRGELFSRAALKCIHNESRGVPRLINVICDRAMLGAYTSEKFVIEHPLVLAACSEVLGISPLGRPSKLSAPTRAILWILALLMLVGILYYSAFGEWLSLLFQSLQVNSPPSLASIDDGVLLYNRIMTG